MKANDVWHSIVTTIGLSKFTPEATAHVLSTNRKSLIFVQNTHNDSENGGCFAQGLSTGYLIEFCLSKCICEEPFQKPFLSLSVVRMVDNRFVPPMCIFPVMRRGLQKDHSSQSQRNNAGRYAYWGTLYC